MIYWNKICGFLFFLTFFCLFASAQKKVSITFNKYHLEIKDSIILPHSEANHLSLKTIISSDFSTCNYGFFCREELKFEKATKFPFKFRLGSLAQCNYYEGKSR